MHKISIPHEQFLQHFEVLANKEASKIFLEYVRPLKAFLLEESKGRSIIIEFERYVLLAWYLWNKVIAETTPVSDEYKVVLQALNDYYNDNNPPEAEALMQLMEERKKTEFKLYKYYLGRFKVYKNRKGELDIHIEESILVQ